MNSGELASELHDMYEKVAFNALKYFFPDSHVVHQGRGYPGGGSDFFVRVDEKIIPIEVKGVKLFRKNGKKTQLGMLKIRGKDILNWRGNTGFVIIVVDQEGLSPSFLCLKIPVEQFFLRYPRGKENTTKEGIWHVRLSVLEELVDDFVLIPKSKEDDIK